MKCLNFNILVLNKAYRLLRNLFFCCISFLFAFNASAQQYNVSGTAVAMTTPGCYKLTSACSQAGAVWNIYKINLNQAFDIILTLNFGNRANIYWDNCVNCGGDGMSFILQPTSTGMVGTGGDVGYGLSFNTSLGIVMDTYTANPSDPTYQHISINKNGDILHGTINELVSYTSAQNWPCITANTTCVSDGQDHLFRFRSTPGLSGIDTIRVYFGFGGNLPSTPTLTYSGNIVANIFNGNPWVYWGVGGSTGGCYNVQTVCMTTVSNFASDTATCVGTPVNFTNNSISGLPITSWKWQFGDGDTSNLQSPVHTYNIAGTYNVSLAIVNSGGFLSTMTHSIVVHPKPNVVVNSPVICRGDTAVLTATGATTYLWNNGLSPGAVQNLIPQNSTSYIVTGTNGWGCVNIDTSFITVNPLPVITLTHDTSLCAGDTINLYVGGANTYLWSTSQTTSSISVSPVVNTIYSVKATDILGCDVDTFINVTMYQAAQLSFSSTPNPAEGCAPVTVTFTDESIPAMQNWLWNFGDGFTSTAQNPVHSFVTSGNFDVSLSVTTTHGCKGAATMPAFVKVYENPVASFTTNGNQFSLSYANVMCNSTASSASVTNWHWDFGSATVADDTSNLQNPSYQYLEQGNFLIWLYVTTIHGCVDSTSISILVVEDSLVFPNFITPNGDGVNDYLFIKNLKNVKDNRLTVFNRWGKKVYDKVAYDPEVDRWDGSDLADGTYFYILTYKSILQQGEHRSSLTIMRH
ncbi:MAG: PKD domain-containing protein [Bacteroidales bacterium]